MLEIIAIALAAGLASAADAPDLQGLQGTWERIEVSINATVRVNPPPLTLTVKGDTMTFALEGKVVKTGSFTLDSHKSPKEMDVSLEEDPVAHAIYELKDEQFKLCNFISRQNRGRPGSLVSNPGEGKIVSIYKRKR